MKDDVFVMRILEDAICPPAFRILQDSKAIFCLALAFGAPSCSLSSNVFFLLKVMHRLKNKNVPRMKTYVFRN